MYRFKKVLPVICMLVSVSYLPFIEASNLTTSSQNSTKSSGRNNFEVSTQKINYGNHCPTKLIEYKFTSQEQIDRFGALWPHCTSAPRIIISGKDIRSFDGLDGIKEITGMGKFNPVSGLYIGWYAQEGSHAEKNPSLIDLVGFNNLTSVVGNIYIQNNKNLQSIDAFHNLTSINSKKNNPDQATVEVRNNPNLVSVRMLENIGEMSEFNLIDNENLQNFSKFQNIKKINNLMIVNNKFTVLGFLMNLKQVGYLALGNNTHLQSLLGLENIHGFISTSSIRPNVTISEPESEEHSSPLKYCGFLSELYKNNQDKFYLPSISESCENTLKSKVRFY